MDDGPESGIDDEEFLDLVFERVVAACEEGTAVPDIEELLAGREHLRARVAGLQGLGRTVARPGADTHPVVPGYTLLAELGRGGMGAVYLARQESAGGRPVALKVLPASAYLSVRARERFLLEARAIAHMRHPHVVTLYDVVASGGICAYAMEWVQGATLAQIIEVLEARRQSGESEPALEHVRLCLGALERAAGDTYPIFVCRIGIAVARALGELHRAGLVHRDVKPSNILLRRDGTPLLSDFGLVHAVDQSLTQSGFVGTTAYASPEQLAGPEGLDARSDVYALGVTLYRALALRLPFDDRRSQSGSSRTPAAMLRLIESGRSLPLRARNRRLPRDLETIVAKAIEVEPGRRYASADDLADDLERMLSLQPIRARPSGPLRRVVKFLRRHRAPTLGIVAGSVVSLALALAAVVYVFLVPRWVEAHVREARLALMDPLQANLLFVNVYWGQQWTEGKDPVPERSGFRAAVRHYDSALRWSPFDAQIRLERDVVLAVLDAPRSAELSSPAAPDDLRSAGLAAYLLGDVESALRSWERLEQSQDPTAACDPLVEAGLGILYLVREEAARAYPRLRDACQAFPDVGFLTGYLADAALRCGDHGVAEHLLAAAARMPRQDPLLALDRIRADLLAAQGLDSEAEALYRRAYQGTPATLHYARFLHARGRVEEAFDQYLLAVSAMQGASVRAEYAHVLEEWWADLGPEERLRHIRSSVGRSPWDPRSLVTRLRYYAGTVEQEGPLLARPVRAMQSLELAGLARALDAENTARWNGMLEYPPLFVCAERWALESAWPAALSDVVRQLAAACELVRDRAARDREASPPAVVSACSDAPCFQGLGDLPGGAVSSFACCLSSDGSTVGGLASGRHGPEEPFVWRAETGMIPVGTPGSGAVRGLSADGSVAVGWTVPATVERAFRWTRDGGTVGLNASDGAPAMATCLSDDGLLAAGRSSAERWHVASTWSPEGGWSSIDAGFDGVVTCLSRDGRWAAGWVRRLPDAPSQAARWSLRDGERVVAARESMATGVSDGGTVVGYIEHADASQGRLVREATSWTGDGPACRLGDSPCGALESQAMAILHDGTWIAGSATSALGEEAVLWDEHRRMYRVEDLLDAAGASAPPGWRLHSCAGITRRDDRITICGCGTNPADDREAWIASLRVARSIAPGAEPDAR